MGKIDIQRSVGFNERGEQGIGSRAIVVGCFKSRLRNMTAPHSTALEARNKLKLWYDTGEKLDSNRAVDWPSATVPRYRPTPRLSYDDAMDQPVNSSWWGPQRAEDGSELWSELGTSVYSRGIAGNSAVIVRSSKRSDPWHEWDDLARQLSNQMPTGTYESNEQVLCTPTHAAQPPAAFQNRVSSESVVLTSLYGLKREMARPSTFGWYGADIPAPGSVRNAMRDRLPVPPGDGGTRWDAFAAVGDDIEVNDD